MKYRDHSILLILFALLLFWNYGGAYTGGADIVPAGFAADTSTPFAIHFTAATAEFSSYATLTARIRINLGSAIAANYTWSSVGIPGWRLDDAGYATFQPFPVYGGGTISGWLFGLSSSSALYGGSSINIRIQERALKYWDATTTPYLYAWNTATDCGWLFGYCMKSNFTLPSPKEVVLAFDSSTTLLGSYISEDNGIFDGYSINSGYFKLAVPANTPIAYLEFRSLNNTFISKWNGPWTVTAGKTVPVGTV
ncbi:MAG: hypothetical protein QME64_09005, partial [bacterium]|nr:hypothetical protein [bacterium]